ncbi:PAS domain-containing methyl-accepting chemotaxis protein [Marivirga sp. S37H4]|uniref:PAS domain-containing methyl-accepting chemotaxis protein n=1 Tax=Marivirga aurantiaca TaxID=2802615 RepID=A0A934X2H2_9BACT|nr:PAS domain-containing methyl-accepting chemotaxis protein [Marivirga aurantiaca]MBK6267257.1 PAS domain-containing methyl-accepting chemotaxis protein [Marivirga aurantiaca]
MVKAATNLKENIVTKPTGTVAIDTDSENLKNYLEAIDNAFASIEFNPEGIILNANADFLTATGYKLKEIKGEHHRIFVSDEYANSKEYKAFWKALADGQSQTGEFLRYCKNGDELWLQASYTSIKDESGKVAKVIKYGQDITKRKQAELAGEKNLKNYLSAVDKAFATIEFDPKGNILNANDQFLNAVGYSLNEIKGKHHKIFVSAKHAQSNDYTTFWNALGSGESQTGEFLRYRKDGKELWLQASYTAIPDENGKVVKVMKYAQDITARKHAEIAGKKSTEEQLEIIEVIRAMAKGDLTKRVDSNSEVAGEVNSALNGLNEVLSKINTSADYVAKSSDDLLSRSESIKNSSNEVASAISQMAKGAQDQALRTDESSKLVDGVMTSSMEMQGKADIIKKTAEDGQKRSEEGLKIIKNLVANMTGIDSSAEKTSASIAILTERAEEIGRTLNVITDIAAQTNLLALNAAIEAARAGDAGRGFAVVAEEIRKLAEDSRKSAVDIEKIISDVQKDTVSAGKAIESMQSSVKEGGSATKDAESIFVEIASSSDVTFQHSKEILSSSLGQKESIDAVVKNIEQIVVVAEETAAGTQQIASSSQELNAGMEEITASSTQLSKIAEDLKAGIEKFTLTKA